MKYLAAILFMATLAASGQQPIADAKRASDMAIAVVDHYRKDSRVTEFILSADANPDIKKCRDSGWPNTDECRGVALGMIQTLTAYFDYKLPRVPRPALPKETK